MRHKFSARFRNVENSVIGSQESGVLFLLMNWKCCGKKLKQKRYRHIKITKVIMTTKEKIMQVIETRISPVLQSHGGDVSFVNFDEVSGTLYVELVGACGT